MSDAEADGMTILVAQTEGPARSELLALLGSDSRIGEVLSAAFARDALRILQSHRVDGVFLDARLSGLSGVELAGVLALFRDPPPVVFVADDADLVDDISSLDFVDRLLKPIRAGLLAEAVDRLAAATSAPTPEPQPTPDETDDESIPVELAGITRFVPLRDVRYAESHGDYARRHTATATHLLRVPMVALETRWADAGFVRIHRSYLVALAHITEVKLGAEEGVVVLGTTQLAVSRRHVRGLRAMLANRTEPQNGTG